jgi:hypothetical protein
MAAISRTRWLISPPAAISLMRMMSNDSAPKNRMITPMISPMSPTRLVRNALSAASVFGFSSHQWPMSTNEQRPTSSQAVRSISVLLAMTRVSIDAENRERKAK